MPDASSRLPRRGARFGPFEADFRTHELRKFDRRIRLPHMPFEVLAALLETPGELVSREELQRRLWSDGTFVDFDNNLNSAVTRLRQALGDAASAPVYIETLPKLGYRFVAAVEFEEPEDPLLTRAAAPASAAGPATEAVHTPAMAPARASPPAPAALETAEPAALVTWPPRPARHGWLGRVVAAGFAIIALGLASAWIWPALAPAPPEPSRSRVMLAVLPFQNLSGVEEQDYLSHGFTEELITELARLDPARLGVVARTTSFKFQGAQKSVAEIARELGVQYVLEGSVRSDGTRLRIAVQLIEAAGQSHVWATSYERDPRDLFVVEQEVARAVAASVKLAVVPVAAEHPRVSETAVAPAAREALLQARFHLSKASNDGVERAIEAFTRAIEIQPDYALAHAGVSRAYIFATRTEPRVALARARTSAERALQIDPALPEGHLAAALARLYADRDLPGAIRAFELALVRDAGNADVHFYYSQALAASGRFEEALAAARRALALDPFSPLVHHYIGRILIFAGRPADAAAHLRQTLDLDPLYQWANLFLAVALEESGDTTGAVAARQRYWSLSGVPPERIARLGAAFETGGYDAVRREWIAWVEDRVRAQGFVTSTELALLHAALGDKDASIRWLTQAWEQQTRDLIYVRVYPEFKILQGDPRFEKLEKQIFGASD